MDEIKGGLWKWDKEKGELVELRRGGYVPIHAIRQDTIEPTLSITGTNKVYDSRSQLKREAQNMGLSWEMAAPSDIQKSQTLSAFDLAKQKEADRRALRDDIERSHHDVKNHRLEFTETQKEIFKQEERLWENHKKRQRR